MSSNTNRYWRNFDWLILIILLGLAIFSYIGISGATPKYSQDIKQLIWYGVGFVLIGVSMFFDYRWLNQLAYFLFAFGLILLIAVLFLGSESYGAVRGFDLGPIKIQPAEFMKIFVIMAIAKWFAKMQEKQIEIRAFYQLWPAFLLIGVAFFLIVIQPDLGDALVLLGIFFCIMVVAKVRVRHFAYLGFIGATGIGLLTYIFYYKNETFFKIIKPKQWERITAFVSTDKDVLGASYQLNQSLTAIGSGTLQGKWMDQELLTNNNWVPFAETDFVFSVLGEKFGFIGSSALLFLFFLLIYRMIRIAMETEDPFGSYVISGIIGMFVFQIFENVGMTIGIMPITGITLSFISYGGSSLFTNMVAVGIVLNIGMKRKN